MDPFTLFERAVVRDGKTSVVRHCLRTRFVRTLGVHEAGGASDSRRVRVFSRSLMRLLPLVAARPPAIC